MAGQRPPLGGWGKSESAKENEYYTLYDKARRIISGESGIFKTDEYARLFQLLMKDAAMRTLMEVVEHVAVSRYPPDLVQTMLDKGFDTFKKWDKDDWKNESETILEDKRLSFLRGMLEPMCIKYVRVIFREIAESSQMRMSIPRIAFDVFYQNFLLNLAGSPYVRGGSFFQDSKEEERNVFVQDALRSCMVVLVLNDVNITKVDSKKSSSSTPTPVPPTPSKPALPQHKKTLSSSSLPKRFDFSDPTARKPPRVLETKKEEEEEIEGQEGGEEEEEYERSSVASTSTTSHKSSRSSQKSSSGTSRSTPKSKSSKRSSSSSNHHHSTPTTPSNHTTKEANDIARPWLKQSASEIPPFLNTQKTPTPVPRPVGQLSAFPTTNNNGWKQPPPLSPKQPPQPRSEPRGHVQTPFRFPAAPQHPPQQQQQQQQQQQHRPPMNQNRGPPAGNPMFGGGNGNPSSNPFLPKQPMFSAPAPSSSQPQGNIFDRPAPNSALLPRPATNNNTKPLPPSANGGSGYPVLGNPALSSHMGMGVGRGAMGFQPSNLMSFPKQQQQQQQNFGNPNVATPSEPKSYFSKGLPFLQGNNHNNGEDNRQGGFALRSDEDEYLMTQNVDEDDDGPQEKSMTYSLPTKRGGIRVKAVPPPPSAAQASKSINNTQNQPPSGGPIAKGFPTLLNPAGVGSMAVKDPPSNGNNIQPQSQPQNQGYVGAGDLISQWRPPEDTDDEAKFPAWQNSDLNRKRKTETDEKFAVAQYEEQQNNVGPTGKSHSQ